MLSFSLSFSLTVCFLSYPTSLFRVSSKEFSKGFVLLFNFQDADLCFALSLRVPVYYNTVCRLCQEVFKIFLKISFKSILSLSPGDLLSLSHNLLFVKRFWESFVFLSFMSTHCLKIRFALCLLNKYRSFQFPPALREACFLMYKCHFFADTTII